MRGAWSPRTAWEPLGRLSSKCHLFRAGGSGGDSGTRGRGAKLTVKTNNQSARPSERLAPALRGGGGPRTGGGDGRWRQGWGTGGWWRGTGRSGEAGRVGGEYGCRALDLDGALVPSGSEAGHGMRVAGTGDWTDPELGARATEGRQGGIWGRRTLGPPG